MTTEAFYDAIRVEAPRLKAAATAGDKGAASVIRLYQMHYASPNDPGALGLCMAALDEWKKDRSMLIQCAPSVEAE